MEHTTGKRYTQLYYKLNKRLFFNLTLYPRNAIAHLATCRGQILALMLNDSIMPAFNKGETRAFKAVFEELYRFLVSLAFKIVGNHEDAEEVAMTAIQNTFNKCAGFEYYLQVRKHLIISTRNIALNYTKSSNFRRGVTLKYTEQFIESIKDDEYLMLEANVKTQIVAELYLRIKKLKRSMRDVMLLTLQELSTKEIAEKLGIAPHSVIVQRSRALEHLRISFNTKTKDNAQPASNRTDSTNHTGGKGNK